MSKDTKENRRCNSVTVKRYYKIGRERKKERDTENEREREGERERERERGRERERVPRLT